MKTFKLPTIKRRYYDDNLFAGFFLSSNLQCLINVSEKLLDTNQTLHIFFMNYSVQRGQNENLKTVTQHLKTRNN